MINASNSTIKEGYLVSQGTDNNSFTHIPYNPTKVLGILTKTTQPRQSAELATTGRVAQVFISGVIKRGDQVRALKSGDRGYQGQSIRVNSTDTDYFLIGEALESGSGLVPVRLDMRFIGQGNGNPATSGLTDVFVEQDPSLPVEYLKKTKNGETSVVTRMVHPNGLVWGGRVSLVSGLTFNVQKAIYYILGQFYTSNATSVTLETADPSLARIDLIVATKTQEIMVITGVPSATPIKPVIDPSVQIELTSILLGAGETTPSGITVELIYDELQAGEWIGEGAIFNSLKNPYNGFYSTEVTHDDSFTYTKSGTIDLIDFTQLTFYIKLTGGLDEGKDIYISFLNGDTVVVPEILAPIDKRNLNYQQVTIPISSGVVDTLKFRFVGGYTFPYYIDLIKLENISGGQTSDYQWNFSAETLSGIVSVPVLNGDKVHFAAGNNIELYRTSHAELGHVLTIHAADQVQSDYDEVDNTAPSYIRNKPTIVNIAPITVELRDMTIGDYVIPLLHCPYNCTILGIAVVCDAFTAELTVKVNLTGVDFNSTIAVPVTTTKTYIAATAHNTVSVGDTISVHVNARSASIIYATIIYEV